MILNDVLFCERLLASIPFATGDKKMSAKTVSDVVILQVSYKNKRDEFDAFMKEVLKKLKKDGFDDRVQKHNRLLEIETRIKAHNEWKEGQTDDDGNPVERPAKPTDEEIKEADEIRKTEPDFVKEYNELDSAYINAYNEKLQEPVEGIKKMSRETYESIVDFFSPDDDIDAITPEASTHKINSQVFLRMLGLNLLSASE